MDVKNNKFGTRTTLKFQKAIITYHANIRKLIDHTQKIYQ